MDYNRLHRLLLSEGEVTPSPSKETDWDFLGPIVCLFVFYEVNFTRVSDTTYFDYGFGESYKSTLSSPETTTKELRSSLFVHFFYVRYSRIVLFPRDRTLRSHVVRWWLIDIFWPVPWKGETEHQKSGHIIPTSGWYSLRKTHSGV